MSKYRFQLRGGVHQMGKGSNIQTFKRGDIIETDIELDKVLASKFVRLDAVGAIVAPPLPPIKGEKIEAPEADADDPYGLLKMSKKELVEFADYEEIVIPSDAKTKVKILKAIQSSIDEE